MSLGASRLRLPLRSTDGPPSEGKFQAPRIRAPRVAGELELKPIRDIAVRELLTHASDGRATVHLPFLETTLRKGPFSIDVPAGTEAVLELHVTGGRISRDRSQTHGAIDPPISLPLGLEFRGIFVEDDGSLVADISNFPNIKLRWLGNRNRIPETLTELVDLLFKDAEAPPATPADGPAKPTLRVDTAGIAVQARDVVPNDRELSLGDAGALALGPGTRLDVDVSPHAFIVSGDFDIRTASLSGAGFDVRELVANGAGGMTLQRADEDRSLSVKLTAQRAAIAGATFRLLDGSRIDLGETIAEDVDIEFRRAGDEVHFQVKSAKVRSHVRGAVLMTTVGGSAHPILFDEMDLEGKLSLGNKGFTADFEIKGAMVSASSVAVPLGLARLELAKAQAVASGRLRIGDTFGYSFTGSMAVTANLASGEIDAGPVYATLLSGTALSLNIAQLSGSDRLRGIAATGEVSFALGSGGLPLSSESRLTFSRGAQGTVALHELSLTPFAPWPQIEAGIEVSARCDPTLIRDCFGLPAGAAELRVARAAIDKSGELLFEGIEVVLHSDDHGEQPPGEQQESEQDRQDGAASDTAPST